MVDSVEREIETMAEAKLAPNLPQWMIDHVNRYTSSDGTEGHMYTLTPPGYSEMTVPSLLLTTTGRKSGEKFIFPLFYGETGNSYIIVASSNCSRTKLKRTCLSISRSRWFSGTSSSTEGVEQGFRTRVLPHHVEQPSEDGNARKHVQNFFPVTFFCHISDR